jgi:hypothetical protein
MADIHRYYIPLLFHWLTDEYNIYSLVIQLNSLIITDEYVLVFYSESEEMTPVGLMRILLSQKMKKIHTVDSAAINGR